MSDNIKVVVKVRPLISREIEDKLSYQWRVKNDTLYQLDQNGRDLGPSFTFDRVYDKDTETSVVYDDIAKPIVQAATAGFNGTIFAYGQTSSGKTYTMTGTDKSPGIIPLAVINLFEIIRNVPDRDFLVRVSYIEIYNETVKDLLNVNKEHIKIQETLQGIKVDATEKVTSSPEEVLEAMKEGEANRQKGATNMNEQSSRSHSIFQIIIESREHIEGEENPGCVNVSQLNLVDLAGSERSGQTGATGIRFKEGTHINKSLSALALVIKQLSEDPNKFANYRDSKLTRILQNSLGGNAKTSIICAITPAAVEETISTLQFANRAKAIKNKPEVNAVATADDTMIQRLTKQMCKLQAQLESKKTIEQDNYKLQSKIQNLQKLILNGFAQRRSVDLMSGTRRKLQQPRRITISTLHSIPDDEPIVTIPKFCTPSLKYNPATVKLPSDFAPIPSDSSKLAPVPEEPARLVTPPPMRTVFFSDEVIELDSDDDDSTRGDTQTCSPIHKCYSATKTPPCILRRNAKEAEKNLKGIIELTEREKMYSPNVVEYIEKLEHNTTVIAKLQDQIELMNKQSKEKDLEVEHLKSKIKQTEDTIKMLTSSKTELQSKCDNYNSRLTDAEVSYETLRNKAKLREEELLSLLEELNARNKKPEDIGKVLSRTLDKEIQFMDISKDISLVNSDSESIVNTNDDEPDHNNVNELLADTQSELNLKNQAVIDLEANIFAQQQTISSLEERTQSLQEEVTAFNKKILLMDSENSLLKSTIETLNTTIKNQKDNLETAKNDIDSYNSLIQELHIKISQKESLPNIALDDSTLETMIANEEKFIANNDNMRNIIHSLKLALETRSKEIEELKKSVQKNSDVKRLQHENVTLMEQLESKTNEIDSLNKQISENITSINKLTHEKNVLQTLEHELTEKLANSQHKTSELEQLNREITISAESLKEENDKLKLTIAENDVSEKQISEMNIKLLERIENLTETISELETKLREKDDLISSLEAKDRESTENLLNAKAAVFKSQVILTTLSGNLQEVPIMMDNFVNVFNVLSNSLNTLENVANTVVKEKEEIVQNNTDLKIMLEVLALKHKTEMSTLQEQLDVLSATETSRCQDNETLTETISQLNNEIAKTKDELNSKNSENESLEAALVRATEHIQTCNVKMTELIERNNELENLTTMLQEKEYQLEDKILQFSLIKEQMKNSIQERDDLLNSIFNTITEFTINHNIQNDTRGEVENKDCIKIHERILLTLDKIGSHITFIGSKNDDGDEENIKVNEILLEAKQEIVELTQQNVSLVEKLSQAENKNSELTVKLTKNLDDNKELSKELSQSQRVLQSLQEELRLKADELSYMEEKVKKWNEQFINHDSKMKQQIDELKLENKQLKTGIPSGRHKPESGTIITYEHKDSYDFNNQDEGNRKKYSDDTSMCSDLSSPPSLLTICCNKIVDSIHPKEVESNTRTTSSNEYSEKSDQNYIVDCKCSELSIELEAAREENYKIIELLEQLEAVNQYLIQEQEETRKEIQLLAVPALELQKKIINHKTNLAILTATTTAENRALKSQVKGLQHHHSRFHNVCQRDIPDFKKQLRELMTLLRGDPSIVVDQQNASFKRYSLPDVLDSSTALPNFKNESTLDGDLLMLDTNVTITTTADNTLTAQDQTCLDLTQFYHEASCQTNDLNQTEILINDMNMYERLNILKEENIKLRELVDKYAEMKQSMIDAQISPIKINNADNENIINSDRVHNETSSPKECDKCKKQAELQHVHEELYDKLKSVSQELLEIKSQKAEIEEKYNNLILETPSTDLLVKKLNDLEKESDIKKKEIAKLNNMLSIKAEQLKSLQDENDSLSTQVMENISEADDLNKELDSMKKINSELLQKCIELEQSVRQFSDEQLTESCSNCSSKDEQIKSLELRLTQTHTKLNRSLSDSDTSSRYNKICTLQSELDAGREDCKEITEDVVTIKNHLDRSNLAMDLDDSMVEYEYAISSPQSLKCTMPDIPEERPIDLYKMEKLDCFNYYVEKTGVDNETINVDIKMLDIMKSFYDHLVTKHGNEVENLTNKLKDYGETKIQLENQISNLKEKHSQVTAELEQKDQNNITFVNALSQIKNNINILNQEIIKFTDVDVTTLFNMCKDNFFKVIDNELGLSSTKIIEFLIDKIVNKHQTDLNEFMAQYSKIQAHMESVTKELSSVYENLEQMKSQLSAKEEEYNLLKKQKERIHEISSAVTLDIVKKEKELTEAISNGYKKLVELHVVKNQDVDLSLPVSVNIDLLFERCIAQYKNTSADIEKEKENLVLQINTAKQVIEEKQKEIQELRTRNQNLLENNNAVTVELEDKEDKLQAQSVLYKDLNEIYESKVKENIANVVLIENLSEEIKLLKATIDEKVKTIAKLELEIDTQNESKEKESTELIGSVKVMQDEIAQLKAINEVIVKEKESYANELLKSGETIKQNNIEMDNMTSDILVLRESVRENGLVIEKLNVEAKNLLKQNMELKHQLEDKCRECYRLETNIKTHEKTAEIQTRMIMRLEKQKNEDDKTISEKTKQIEELKQKGSMQNVDSNEIELLRKIKEALEARVTELEEQLSNKSRPSIDALADLSRRRRQSLHDSKRLFGEDKHDIGDHSSVEAVFDSRPKPDDLFMDVDEDISNRSSPIMRHSKGRDSLSVSKTDQEEDQPSRPSSVVATRRRRQSIHDLHRSVLRHTPSPDISNRILDEVNHSKPSDTSGDAVSEVANLRERLALCQQELEDLKEKYRELDEECETCAEYLRERDEQCSRLKKEKTALQTTVADLTEKLQSCNPNQSQQLAPKASVGVNTDEDWANLHSVVVDRMSYDAEVEKNKRLTKTIEELRFKKQDLKNMLGKMQKALEKNNNHRELDAARHELQACKQELSQLRVKYKELDDECETCAQYLREKEEQCRRLKEAKNALETQLHEFQGEHNSKSQSTRKKRQSLHDQNRTAAIDVRDACTETADDLLIYQVERDGSSRSILDEKQAKEMKHLKLVVEKLQQQKTFLEQQLVSVSAMQPPQPMYVATGSGIVQNQQLTDVMKENQKLKKINAKLVNICKKRGKDSNRENEDPAERG